MNAFPKVIAGVLLATAALIFPVSEAAAQTYPCGSGPGPGERQVGATPAGDGMASIPLCESDGGGNGSGPAQPFDLADVGNSISAAMKQYVADLAAYYEYKGKLESDPRYQRYMRGQWHVFQAGKTAKPGENCTAIWGGQGVMMMISGWPTDAGGMFTFWGPDIPKPKKAVYVTVAIKQSDGTTQKIKAVNYAPQGVDFGTVMLEVESLTAAIDDIKDVYQMELLLKGKTIIKTDWHDGFAARKKLQACVAG